MTVRIGVNLAWLVPGVVGGSEEATVAALRSVRPFAATAGVEVVLFGLDALVATHPDLATDFEFHRVGSDGRNKVARVVAENTGLGRSMRAAGIGLAHHAGGVVPPGVRLPATLAVHDTQPLDLPENFSWAKRRYLGLMIGHSVRSALRVTVPSAFVRGRVLELTGADPTAIDVVPWSVPDVVAPDADTVAAAVERLGVDGRRPFVLYPAISYPHKNHVTLLEAVAMLDGVDLVLTGRPGPLDEAIRARAARPDLAGRVHSLGRVGRDDLLALLHAAAVVAVPSRYEGFGLPALEALAAGRPTVVADAGSLPEVVEDGAMVVGADDVAAWSHALDVLLSDPARRDELVSNGRRVAASWSPERTGRGLIDAWVRAVDRLPSLRKVS